MKITFVLFSALFLSTRLFAQTILEISTGTGYQKQEYIQLGTDAMKQVNNTAWDIAFTVYGQQDAGIFVNESAGTSMGQALPQVELYDAMTINFNETPDPALLTDNRLYNSEISWLYGAFNETRNTSNAFDFGWGVYNFQTNQVSGNRVYVLKLRNGQYRKLQIVSLIGTVYTFRYANLDGSGEVTKTIDKNAHSGKTLAYFSFETGNTVDVEPAGSFDLVYQRYITQLWEPVIMEYIAYNVTGILSGRGVQVAEADGVNPNTVSFTAYKDSLRSELDIIGHDWKTFAGTAWTIDDDKVFFVKTADNHLWKLHFIDFEGSATGTAIAEKTDLGIFTSVKNPADLGFQVKTYPNPVTDQLFIALDVPFNAAQEGMFLLTDLQGRTVLQQSVQLQSGFQVAQIPVSQLSAGLLFVQLQLPGQNVFIGKIIIE